MELVHIEVGPVSAASAWAWISYAEAQLGPRSKSRTEGDEARVGDEMRRPDGVCRGAWAGTAPDNVQYHDLE